MNHWKLWRPVLVKINIIKWHHKWLFWPVQHLLWTRCVFLSSLNNTFFSVFVIIFNNKSFCFNYSNTFFIHAMNYFSVVLRIIFLMYIKNYFLIGPRIIFRCIANLFLGLKRFAGLAVKRTGSSLLLPWAIILKTLQVKECFQRECQGETLSGKETKEVFIFLTKSVRS